jgi:hypothetical protein
VSTASPSLLVCLRGLSILCLETDAGDALQILLRRPSLRLHTEAVSNRVIIREAFFFTASTAPSSDLTQDSKKDHSVFGSK